jgi:Na+-translocating ferredoxin:NAD+ oxidoreductase subunit C
MGGAGFPTHVKLSPKNEGDIDTIIVNAAECEPYLTSDYRRILEETDKLIKGLKIVLQIFPKATGHIAVEDNKPDAIKLLQEKIQGENRIVVDTLRTKYPQGGERCLIYAVTKRKINSSMLPADAGCIVHNVDTIVSIYNAVMEKRPLTRRIVTVTGDAVKNPRNFLVYVGTPYTEIAEAAGGFISEPEKMISGGPMMGFAMYSLNVPVTKNTSSLLAFTHDTVKDKAESPCIRCGRCGEVCPENLLPAKLSTLARRGAMDAFVASYGMECVECGCCSYICPAKRQLTQSIKAMRKMVMAERRKKK